MTTENDANKKDKIQDIQPIRSRAKIEDMKWSLKNFCSERDYIMFLLGINTGLRIADLLKLKINDVVGKTRITVTEGKNKKRRAICLSNIYEELNSYIIQLNNTSRTEWLFPSHKGDYPICTVQAYRQLNKAAEMIGICGCIGTSTMRKTFGYWHYKQFKDTAALQMIFNHPHQRRTLNYIGITEKGPDLK